MQEGEDYILSPVSNIADKSSSLKGGAAANTGHLLSIKNLIFFSVTLTLTLSLFKLYLPLIFYLKTFSVFNFFQSLTISTINNMLHKVLE